MQSKAAKKSKRNSTKNKNKQTNYLEQMHYRLIDELKASGLKVGHNKISISPGKSVVSFIPKKETLKILKGEINVRKQR